MTWKADVRIGKQKSQRSKDGFIAAALGTLAAIAFGSVGFGQRAQADALIPPQFECVALNSDGEMIELAVRSQLNNQNESELSVQTGDINLVVPMSRLSRVVENGSDQSVRLYVGRNVQGTVYSEGLEEPVRANIFAEYTVTEAQEPGSSVGRSASHQIETRLILTFEDGEVLEIKRKENCTPESSSQAKSR